MMKVLYLLNFAGKAGTERYVESLVRYLNGKRIEAYFAYNTEGLLVQRLRDMGVETFHIELRSRFDTRAAKKLAELCKKLGIDVVHTHYLRENYIALLAKTWNKHIRVVYTNHFVMGNDLVTRLSNRLLAGRQDVMIAVCNRGREQLIQNGNDAGKISVVFNGVDPAVWYPPEPSTLRQEFGIGEDTVVMLCASRFAGDKGHRYLVDSVKRLESMTERPFVMVLACDGELLETVKEQVRVLGLEKRVLFTGFRSDMKNLYNGSDVYVNSSQHEALSFLIIEAMASGLPVIVTDMAGNRDTVEEDSDWGLLVKYDDPESMAGAMKKLIESPELRAHMSAAALRRVDERFNIYKVSEETYRLYQQACASKKRR